MRPRRLVAAEDARPFALRPRALQRPCHGFVGCVMNSLRNAAAWERADAEIARMKGERLEDVTQPAEPIVLSATQLQASAMAKAGKLNEARALVGLAKAAA